MKYLDLGAQWAPLVGKILPEIEAEVKACRFVGGPMIERLENALGEYTGFKYAIAVSSGTMAIQAVCEYLRGLGYKKVQIPDLTFAATAFGASLGGLYPTRLRAPGPDEACLVEIPRDKLTIPVDLYGTPVDYFAETNYPLFVDACQSLGAKVRNKNIGETNVWAAAISFYPGKNLGTWGEGGAVVTSDPKLNDWVRMYVNQGQRTKGDHEIHGTNGRMSSLLAIPLYHGLSKLDEWNDRRRGIARLYDLNLDSIVQILDIPEDRMPTRHIYPIFVEPESRDETVSILKSKGIPVGVHYKRDISAILGYDDENPWFAGEISLPIHAYMTHDKVRRVVEALS